MRSLLVFMVVPTLVSAQRPVDPSTLADLLGTWKGDLLYMDYSSGAETRIPATLLVRPLGERRWLITFGYPDEPNANDTDTMALSSDGRVLDGMAVMRVSELKGGTTRITLEKNGEDDNRPARIRKLWTIGDTTCTLRKEVCAQGEKLFGLRHEYRFTRSGSAAITP